VFFQTYHRYQQNLLPIWYQQVPSFLFQGILGLHRDYLALAYRQVSALKKFPRFTVEMWLPVRIMMLGFVTARGESW
jgi:hypothetical protein